MVTNSSRLLYAVTTPVPFSLLKILFSTRRASILRFAITSSGMFHKKARSSYSMFPLLNNSLISSPRHWTNIRFNTSSTSLECYPWNNMYSFCFCSNIFCVITSKTFLSLEACCCMCLISSLWDNHYQMSLQHLSHADLLYFFCPVL